MSRTISQLKNDLSRKLHGTNINHVEDVDGCINEAAREVLADIDFFETKITEQVANAIYSDVYDYSTPTDLKTNKIIDIRPQVNRNRGDNSSQTYGKEFDRFKSVGDLTIKDNKGVRTLRFNSGAQTLTALHTMDSITDNGTWSVGDDGSNLTLDDLNYVSGTGSLNFDTSGSTTTVSLQNTTINAVDLADCEDKGALFVWVYMPVAITNATLIWGDDLTANYWSDTVTTPQNGSFVVGWNLIRFDWNGSTKTGSPDSSAVGALKISFTYDGNADTDYRVDNIVCSQGEIYEIEYYSKYLFRTSDGTWQEEITDDTNYINLEADGYNCLLYKTLEIIAPQVQAEDAGFDYQLYNKQYTERKSKYQQKYKSEILKPKQYYYRQSRKVTQSHKTS